MNQPSRMIWASLLGLAILPWSAALNVEDALHVVETPDGWQLQPSTPLPLASGGPDAVCLPRSAFYPLTPNWTVSFTFTPTDWLPSGTLASATGQWSLLTSGRTLRLVVTKSPVGRSGYNRMWMLGVQDRLVGTPHTITVTGTVVGHHPVTRLFLDGELRAQLRDEVLTGNPGSGGQLCIGTSWPMAVQRLEVYNATWTPAAYTAPQPYSVYPGLLRLAPIPVTPGVPVVVNATVTAPSEGTAVYLAPMWMRQTGEQLPARPPTLASLLIMGCGVGGRAHNQTFTTTAAPAFRAANQTLTCLISDASYNQTQTDLLAADGHDLGLEYDITRCADLTTARQRWLLDQNYSSANSFVNYFGITAEDGIACTQRLGLSFLNAISAANTDWFRPSLRHAACDYKSDVLKCFTDALAAGAARDEWTVISGHWNSRYYNDSLWTDLLAAAQRLNLTFQSVAEVQRTYFPMLGQGPTVLIPPPDAVALVPTLHFYSDGLQTPTLHALTIAPAEAVPPCVPTTTCAAWDAVCLDGRVTRPCTDGCGAAWTETAACVCTPPS